jgi:hypothetical protein
MDSYAYICSMTKQRLDKIWVGVVLGFVLPCIFFYVFYLVNYSYTTFKIMVEHYFEVGGIAALLSLSLLTNLTVFFALYWTKFQMAPRGVILATFVWGAAIVYFKTM